MRTLSQAIIEYICDKYGLTIAELRSSSRKWRISHPRQECMVLLVTAGFSQPQIGRMLGGRDHTTVIHAVRAMNKRQPNYTETAKKIVEAIKGDCETIECEESAPEWYTAALDALAKTKAELTKTYSQLAEAHAEIDRLKQIKKSVHTYVERDADAFSNRMNRAYGVFALREEIQSLKEQLAEARGEYAWPLIPKHADHSPTITLPAIMPA